MCEARLTSRSCQSWSAFLAWPLSAVLARLSLCIVLLDDLTHDGRGVPVFLCHMFVRPEMLQATVAHVPHDVAGHNFEGEPSSAS
jgi:hypothetical protein